MVKTPLACAVFLEAACCCTELRCCCARQETFPCLWPGRFGSFSGPLQPGHTVQCYRFAHPSVSHAVVTWTLSALRCPLEPTAADVSCLVLYAVIREKDIVDFGVEYVYGVFCMQSTRTSINGNEKYRLRFLLRRSIASFVLLFFLLIA